jgi:DNA-binding PadR family transcriptional regulator
MASFGVSSRFVSRLPSSSYWILCALAEGDSHGYVIAQRIKLLAEGEVRVGTGTLYAAIERLVAGGLIELVREEVVDGRNRRSYRLTGAGRTAATEETSLRASAVRRARRQLGVA